MIEVKIYTAPWCTKCKEKSFVELLEMLTEKTPTASFEYINEGDEDFPDDVLKIPTVRIINNTETLHEYTGVREITESIEMDLASVLI